MQRHPPNRKPLRGCPSQHPVYDAGVSEPASFTAADFEARMARAGVSAAADGFAGVLVTPGPDLGYLCGYTPPAATERLTLLVVLPGRRPALIVPRLERGDAAKAAGAEAYELIDWTDGMDPYSVAAALVDAGGRYAISDNT